MRGCSKRHGRRTVRDVRVEPEPRQVRGDQKRGPPHDHVEGDVAIGHASVGGARAVKHDQAIIRQGDIGDHLVLHLHRERQRARDASIGGRHQRRRQVGGRIELKPREFVANDNAPRLLGVGKSVAVGVLPLRVSAILKLLQIAEKIAVWIAIGTVAPRSRQRVQRMCGLPPVGKAVQIGVGDDGARPYNNFIAVRKSVIICVRIRWI